MVIKRNNKGFTLIEILISLAISGLVLTAIYQTFLSQQRAYIAQSEVAAMQQNLRAAMYMMTSELRMVGFDPTGDAGAGIVAITDTVGAGSIRFTKDDWVDPTNPASTANGSIADSGEDITYSLYTSGGVRKLGRKNPTINQPVAENIEVLDLVYLDEDNGLIASPAVNINNIRSIQITIVARSGREDLSYTNSFVYRNQQGTVILGSTGDGYRRAILTSQVKCRNLGL